MLVPTSSAISFISGSNVFGVLSISFAVASTKTCIIYWVMLKNKLETSYSWILKDRNLDPVLQAAMMGCRYPMVPTSALHQWLC